MNIDLLRAQCGGPRDGALLRFALGNALLNAGDHGAAVVELRQALVFDPTYSAAWKLIGKACLANGDADGFDQGISQWSVQVGFKYKF